ncbi:Uncharacterised protein [Acinetobacter baumannii]|nr:Uncharacterised protein [Acinetobacter baumannii]
MSGLAVCGANVANDVPSFGAAGKNRLDAVCREGALGPALQSISLTTDSSGSRDLPALASSAR